MSNKNNYKFDIDSKVKKELGKNYIFKLMKYFLPYKKMILLCTFLIVLSIAVGIATPEINSLLSGSIIPNKKIAMFVLIISILAILEFVNIFAGFYKSKLINTYGYKIIGQIRNDVYDKLTNLSMKYFNENATGTLIIRSTDYVDSLASFYTSHLFTLVEHTIRICLVVPFLFASNPILATLGFFIIIPIIGLVAIVSKITIKKNKIFYDNQTDACSALVEQINGINTITSYNKEDECFDRYYKIKHKAYKSWISLTTYNSFYNNAFNSTYNVAIGLIYILSFVFITRGEFTFAGFVAYIGYQGQLWGPFNYITQLFNSFNNISGTIEQVFTTLEMEEKVRDTYYSTSTHLKGNIEFQNVNFSYESENALKNVSFTIKAGQKVSLSGPPNSGKSTIIELIGRLYDFADGTILLDGKNIKSLKQSSIHKNIGIIQQNTFIINDTILNNIKFGDKKISNDECVQICKLIGAHGFIEKLGGYDKVVGDDENSLSDGERQLINLARILVKNPNIIIYDEALSSLPKAQETELIKLLISKFKGKTMVFATNNQEVVNSCDVNITLRNGKIVLPPEEKPEDSTINNTQNIKNNKKDNWLQLSFL